MIKPGICSVTFRDQTPEEIIRMVVDSGLKGIEWGADIHVPPGDVETAHRVGEQTRAAGLEVAGYGSYFFADGEDGCPDFAFVLESAEALGAPVIRIWAGSPVDKENKTAACFSRVVKNSRRAAEAAASTGIKVAYEFHAHTFTETMESACSLMNEISHPNLYTYWQPPHGSRLEQRLDEISTLKERLLNLHIFHWEYTGQPPFPRLGLHEGEALWKPCLTAADDSSSERFALMEFVRGNSVDQFRKDARTLKRWVEEK